MPALQFCCSLIEYTYDGWPGLEAGAKRQEGGMGEEQPKEEEEEPQADRSSRRLGSAQPAEQLILTGGEKPHKYSQCEEVRFLILALSGNVLLTVWHFLSLAEPRYLYDVKQQYPFP